jgi:hypothetical protein
VRRRFSNQKRKSRQSKEPRIRAAVLACVPRRAGRTNGEKHEANSADRVRNGSVNGRSYACRGSKWPTHRRIPTGAVEPQPLLQLLQLLCLALLRAILLFSAPLLSRRLSGRSSLPLYELGLLAVLAFASRISAALVVRATSQYSRQSFLPRPGPIISPPNPPRHPMWRQTRQIKVVVTRNLTASLPLARDCKYAKLNHILISGLCPLAKLELTDPPPVAGRPPA